jgi:hypothetical protein
MHAAMWGVGCIEKGLKMARKSIGQIGYRPVLLRVPDKLCPPVDHRHDMRKTLWRPIHDRRLQRRVPAVGVRASVRGTRVVRTRGSSDRNRGRSLGTVPKDGPERIGRAPEEQSRSHPTEQRGPAGPTAKSANLVRELGCTAQRESRLVDQSGATGVVTGGA